MHPVFDVILLLLWMYMWVVIAVVILSWLVAFNIINRHNQIVRQVQYFLHRLTEPLLGPIRRAMPDLGGIDISPIILLVGIYFLQQMIRYYA